jgi:amino acid transporter
MGSYLLAQVKDGPLSIFLGFWSTLTNALFAYIGTELIGVCYVALPTLNI